MILNCETLVKMKKNVLAGKVLDYKKRFDSTLSTINFKLKDFKPNFNKFECDLAISRLVIFN